jgi:hypothetical protein
MSIEQPNVIDLLVHDKAKQRALLLISDHLDWEKDEDYGHLKLLQDKLNHYIWFIESGKMLETIPDLKGLPVFVVVWGKYALSDQAKACYDFAKKPAEEMGFSLEFDLSDKSFEDHRDL